MDRLRIGVIGLGWFGEIHCDAIVGVADLELAALCTRTPERLAAMASKFKVAKTTRDYREMLADPEIDAVSIVTMWDQHTEPAIAALEAGKHVFLEKPMASTVEDCKRIIAAGRHQRRIMELMAFELSSGCAEPAIGKDSSVPVAEIHPTLGEACLDAKKPRHAMNGA